MRSKEMFLQFLREKRKQYKEIQRFFIHQVFDSNFNCLLSAAVLEL